MLLEDLGSARAKRERRSRLRSLAVALTCVASMLVLTGGVFTVASTSRELASESTTVHQLDKALTSITVVRAQMGFGLILVDLDEFAAIDTTDAVISAESDIELSLAALQETRQTLEESLGGLEAETMVALNRFERLVESRMPLDTMTALDEQGAIELEAAYTGATEALVIERDVAIAAVEAADGSLGQLSTLIGFLTAFVIPSLAIIIYRLLTAPRRELMEAEAITSRETAMAEIRRGVMFERMDTLRREAAAVVGSDHDRARLDRQFNNLRRTVLTLERTQHCVFSEVRLADVLPTVATMGTDGPVLSIPDLEQPPVWSDAALLELLLASLLTDCEKRGATSVSVESEMLGGRLVVSVDHDGAKRSPGECSVFNAQATITDRLDLLRGPDVELVTAFRLAEDLQAQLVIEDDGADLQRLVLALPVADVAGGQASPVELAATNNV